MNSFTVATGLTDQFAEITDRVRQLVHQSGISTGIVTVYCPHTTAGITINENADPDVVHDMLLALKRLVPRDSPKFRHAEGNSDSHVKASMMGSSCQVIIDRGELVLGTWQGIYLCEFDGPRTRTVHVQIMGSTP
jgi:secondary thiamine-phosphate synthase enzyme